MVYYNQLANDAKYIHFLPSSRFFALHAEAILKSYQLLLILLQMRVKLIASNRTIDILHHLNKYI